MDFGELAAARYSVRAYRSDPVEDEKLEKVMQAAGLAPTAANRQPIRFVVVRTAGKEQDLKRVYGRDWFTQAPIVICACAVAGEAWVRPYDSKNHGNIDVAIAMDHLILQATDLGLGTCWICNFDPIAAREVLDLPDGVEPVAFTPLGYPADSPREKTRRGLDEIVIGM